ncbi:hypothetical protein AGOR_G00215540 [Albula goreensis]|uniref:RELT-like protein 2 n=1 Tax=Albula goreensis TaxID=1534307 RepID=A0A8T3CKK8_9TELE|nr:hypothetical protein AGOR_G00215540 [Albula goreensis]
MTDQENTNVGEPPPQYMIFLLVFFFFLTGLLGFLICHMLKKKGYRCRTGDLDDDEDCEDKLAPGDNDDGSEDNQDTVEQILKCIIQNEANMEAFQEMLGNQNTCEHNDARLPRKESLGGIPPHHHTVHSGMDRNSCHLCAQSRSKKARRRSRVARSKARPGEQTVFSVGRFRVTHMEKKNSIQGSTNLPVNESGDQSEHTLPLDDPAKPREEGYNLRNMFKDVSPTNGVVPMETKRKKSVTLLTPRRGSDPVVGTKKTLEPVAAMEDVGNGDNGDNGDDGDDGDDDNPDTPEQPESSVPPPEEGTDTDVPTDSEMAVEKPPTGVANVEEVIVLKAVPERIREFSVVRMGEPADEAAQGEDGRDDMVEMEDIKDCRVSQEEDGRHSREEKRRSVHSQHKW